MGVCVTVQACWKSDSGRRWCQTGQTFKGHRDLVEEDKKKQLLCFFSANKQFYFNLSLRCKNILHSVKATEKWHHLCLGWFPPEQEELLFIPVTNERALERVQSWHFFPDQFVTRSASEEMIKWGMHDWTTAFRVCLCVCVLCRPDFLSACFNRNRLFRAQNLPRIVGCWLVCITEQIFHFFGCRLVWGINHRASCRHFALMQTPGQRYLDLPSAWGKPLSTTHLSQTDIKLRWGHITSQAASVQPKSHDSQAAKGDNRERKRSLGKLAGTSHRF